MRPSARFAAGIDILEAVLRSNRAADRILVEWQRSNRYAGAKDRRAISEQVYAALREQGLRRWRLAEVGVSVSARNLMLADSQVSPEERAALLEPGPHSAPPLTEQESDWIARLPDIGRAPLWARLNIPEELADLAAAAFGPDVEAECTALNDRAALDLRVNLLRSRRDDVLAQCRAIGIDAQPTPYSPLGIRLHQHLRLEKHPLYEGGLVEPQDEAAQVAGLLLGAGPGETIIDLCAGAGGKTLLFAAQMRNRGRLIAADHDPRRLARLPPRLRRAGVTCVETFGPDRLPDLLREMAGQADRVFLDVPCSGSGTWRRNPEARWRFSRAALAELQAAQQGLLEQGASLVRPGGSLVYATCSIFPDENDRQVERFLGSAAGAGFREKTLPESWQNVAPGLCPLQGNRLSLTPLRHQTDGFFAAVLQRRDG